MSSRAGSPSAESASTGGGKESTEEAPTGPLPGPDVQIGAIGWYRDYDVAKALAERTGRPLWVHFGEHPG